MAEVILPQSKPNPKSYKGRFKSEPNNVLRKKVPPRDTKEKNDFYVTRKSDFKGQLVRCLELIEKGEEEIVIHGLGAAVNRAINLALQIEEKLLGTYQLDVTTSTVKLVDELEPEGDQGDYTTQTRSNSAVHIRIFKVVQQKEA